MKVGLIFKAKTAKYLVKLFFNRKMVRSESMEYHDGSSPRLEELGGTKIYIDRRANRVYIAIDITCQYYKNGEWVCCGRCIKRAASTDIDTNVIDKILLTRNEMKNNL